MFSLLFYNCISIISGQNLVSNPSFEDFKEPLKSFADTNYEFIKSIEKWTTPNLATPDFISPEFKTNQISFGKPKTGKCMIGLKTGLGWAEYIEIELKENLESNQIYYVEFWIKRGKTTNKFYDKDQIANQNFGIQFLKNESKYNGTTTIIGSPHIFAKNELWLTSDKWEKISDFFVPNQSFKILRIGQFRKMGGLPIVLDGYFLIDDVMVRKVEDLTELTTIGTIPSGAVVSLKNIHFKNGTAEPVDSSFFQEIDKLFKVLSQNPWVKIKINGHTDSVGKKKDNQILSEKRAQFILQCLLEKGIDSQRMKFEGFGESKPKVENETPTNRQINRRVEVEFIE